jgi:hypothetical protein
MAQSATGILSEFSWLHVILILVIGTFVGYTILSFIFSYIKDQSLLLKNAQYFVTDQRILSIRPFDEKESLIISLPFEKIDEFFMEQPKNKPFFHLFFKSTQLNSEEMNTCFLSAKKEKEGIKVVKKIDFRLPEQQFVLIWRQLKTQEKLTEVLLKNLPNKQRNILLTDSSIEKIEAHIGG